MPIHCGHLCPRPYENAGKTLRINVETDFASQDTLTVSGLSFTNLIQACFPERLCMDIHNDGKTDAFCNSATCVTVKRRGTIGDGGASASMLSNKRLIIWEGTVITGQ